jgi:hypothetical protein
MCVMGGLMGGFAVRGLVGAVSGEDAVSVDGEGMLVRRRRGPWHSSSRVAWGDVHQVRWACPGQTGVILQTTSGPVTAVLSALLTRWFGRDRRAWWVSEEGLVVYRRVVGQGWEEPNNAEDPATWLAARTGMKVTDSRKHRPPRSAATPSDDRGADPDPPTPPHGGTG